MGLRVTLVSPYSPWPDRQDVEQGHAGGVEVALAGSARALARRGAEVTVLSSGRRPGERVVEGVRHVQVRRMGTVFRTPLSAAFLAPLDADLVHVPATYPLYSDLLLARAARRLPVVLDYHFEPHPTSLPMAAAHAAWRVSLGRLMRRADLVLVRSGDYARGRLDWARHLRVVPNGVDVDRFRPEGGREGYVLCVGRLIPYKGVEVLLRAMAQVQRRRRAPLVVAGDGPLRGALQRQAQGLGLAAQFLGYVPDRDLPGLYARASATVLPSVNGQEAFGVSLLESLACGTPVVASALPGVRELAGLGGRTAPPGDAGALAAALLEVLEAGEGGFPPDRVRARVVERYAWPAVAEALLAAYGEARALRGAP